jgi:MinD-like ATPase involved in chromosome partitioning or flagellar assembly
MGQIVTFYSYKGGVGRSMAMANVAVLLAQRGLRVLAVDWDLEAPGLERYFSYFQMTSSGDGLLNLLINQGQGGDPEFGNYVWQVQVDPETDGGVLDFLPSGKETDDEYSFKLECFDWEAYFAKGGGDYLESLRDYWKDHYDATLIDSRTGLSDAGGICTIQMPDVAVAMFTANYQSLYGVRDIMRLAQAARHELAYDRMHLSVLPLPARFGTRSEFQESQEWLERFADALSEFYHDWVPSWLDPRVVVEALKVPQVDFFGFGERLAVVEQGISDPDSMGFVYDRLASLIAGDLQNVEQVLGIDPPKAKAHVSVKKTVRTAKPDYKWDLYVSYARDPALTDYLQVFVEELENWIGFELGVDARIFFDVSELMLERSVGRATESLYQSKLILPVLTPRYFHSQWAQEEWLVFEQREKVTGASPLIVPVSMRGLSEFPDWAANRHMFDLSDLPLHAAAFRDKRRSLQMTERVQQLAKLIVPLLGQVPPYDPSWPKQSQHGSSRRAAERMELAGRSG